MSVKFVTPWNVADHVGETLLSDWLTVDQDTINAFGEITLDPDPHHIDPEFCARMSPWGKPIAFGFLTLSLMTPLMYQVFRYPLDGDPAEGFPANYGFNRLRFVDPVPVDSRIRGRFTITSVSERRPGQQLSIFDTVIEIENHERPAIVAEWEFMWITPQHD